jgi:hypothetical protein
MNLSPEKIEKTPDIFQLHSLPHNDVSILEIYKLEIERYIKDKNDKKKNTYNKLKNADNIKLLKYFSENIYDNYLVGTEINIEEFSRLFVKCKHDIITIIKDINNYFMLLNTHNKKNPDMFFSNPIGPLYSDYELIHKDFFSKRITRNALGQDETNLKIALNVFLNGDLINLKTPSIGLVYFQCFDPSTPGDKYPTYMTLIEYILNEMKDNPNEIHKNIPFKILGIGNTLADFLLNNRENIPLKNNLNNTNLFSNRFNNTKTRNIITDVINGIQINFNDVLLIKKSKGKNRNTTRYTVKPEYIIPYKMHTDGSIKYMKKSEIDKELVTFEKTSVHNATIMNYVIEQTIILYSHDTESAISKLDSRNFKNVLACFIYILIRLVYNICKIYINAINEIIISMSEAKKGQFYGLNYKNAFDYLTRLDVSLLNFRNVLLNNFYNMFLPSKISKMGYGMTTDANGCFVPEENCIFLGESKNILEKYPINSCDITTSTTPTTPTTPTTTISNIRYDIEDDLMVKFILSTNDKYDIYDKNKLLQFGGYVFNKDIMKITTKLLKEYYVYLHSVIELNLFIFEKMTHYFNVKKMIPFEVISDFNVYRALMTGSVHWRNSDTDYQSLERNLLSQFEYNLLKSTNYYKKMHSIKLKIKQVKQNNISKLYSFEEMFLISFNLYYRRSTVLYNMVKNLISNTKLKFSLLKKFNERKKFYENEINQFIKSS